MQTPVALIKTALASAVKLVNSGVSPTEALSKVAKEHDLNQNYIQRVGESLNVSLTFNHMKTA